MSKNDEQIVDAPSAVPTVEERLEAYNSERKVIDEKYGFVLMADAFIDTSTGLIRARPTVVPVELIPKQEDLMDNTKVSEQAE